MTDAEILAKAMAAQMQSGPAATIEVFLERLPCSRYVKQMRLRAKQGPWGQIIALTPDGTTVRFEVSKLMTFYSAISPPTEGKKLQPRSANRVQIKPVISRSLAERLAEISANRNQTISAVLENVLRDHIERYA